MILPGQTNRTVAYAAFQFTNSGSYNVVVSNADGITISFPASLSVSNAPLRAWGYNYDGQLGNGTLTDTNRPTLVTNNVVAVAAGDRHSLFVKADGTLWTMGFNGYGQLGLSGIGSSLNRPGLVTNNVVAVAAGYDHSLFVKADGSLWAMGKNWDGQLGDGTTVNNTNRPVLVNGGGLLAASLSKEPTADHSLAIAGIAPVVGALTNQMVNLGQPTSFIASVSAGDGPFTYQWQKNGTNLLGATNTTYSITNAALTNVGNYSVTVTGPCGRTTSISAALTVNTLFITRQPVSAVLRLGEAASLNVTNGGIGPFGYQWLKDGAILPGQTNSTLAYTAFQFTNSGSYNVVITNANGLTISFPASLSISNAPLRVWGDNYYGQLGTGSTVNTTRPSLVTSNVVAMAAGFQHSLLVKANGTLWAMGDNYYGQLGIGSAVNTNRPSLVTSSVVAMAAGYQHSMLLQTDGTLWAMGNNSSGQLGNGGTVNRNRPIVVTNNVVAVAAGGYHSLFVKADGTLSGPWVTILLGRWESEPEIPIHTRSRYWWRATWWRWPPARIIPCS